MYYVYAIKSLTHRYIYVGLTNNLRRRLRQHNDGKETTTSHYRPFELIYQSEHVTRIEARMREKHLKTGSGKEFLKSIDLVPRWRNW